MPILELGGVRLKRTSSWEFCGYINSHLVASSARDGSTEVDAKRSSECPVSVVVPDGANHDMLLSKPSDDKTTSLVDRTERSEGLETRE